VDLEGLSSTYLIHPAPLLEKRAIIFSGFKRLADSKMMPEIGFEMTCSSKCWFERVVLKTFLLQEKMAVINLQG
jgi:hypothetical protein